MKPIITPKFQSRALHVFTRTETSSQDRKNTPFVALFEKGADLSALKTEARRAAEDKWGKDSARWPKDLRSSFRPRAQAEKGTDVDGKKFLPAGYVEGAEYLNLKSKLRPASSIRTCRW